MWFQVFLYRDFEMTSRTKKCQLVGKASELDMNELPTTGMLIQNFLYISEKCKETTKKSPSAKNIIREVIQNVKKIWMHASIPTVANVTAEKKFEKIYNEYVSLKKYVTQAQRSSQAYKNKAEKFKNLCATLFDIAACKCSNLELCSCKKNKKIPVLERQFIIDQRTKRKMKIGGIDKFTSMKLQRREQRKESSTKNIQNPNVSPTTVSPLTSTSDSETSSTSDVFEPRSRIDDPREGTSKGPIQKQMRVQLPNLAKALDRAGVSDRAGALIASAVLKDVGIIDESDQTMVVDKSKVRRERKSSRIAAKEKRNRKRDVFGLYFDGRKDKTLVNEEREGSYYRTTKTEEHLSFVEEPGSAYFGHTSLEGGSAQDIKNAVVNFLFKKDVNIDSIKVVGCDGTAVNTGKKGGALALLEAQFKKPLQWAICLLHANELPLRHLITKLDGVTTGPHSFSGDIGQALRNCEKLPIVPFTPLESNLPQAMADGTVSLDLSTDQKYLWEMVNSISEGVVSLALSRRNPGALSHARWLTAANRILRLYVSTETPSNALKDLVEYIVRVYAPVWFSIRMKPSMSDGAKHLFQLVQLSRYLRDELKNIIDPVIERNAFWAHPENLLISMLFDEDLEIRTLARKRILKSRAAKNKKQRQFVIPELNFDVESYTEMINWHKTGETEPPVLKGVDLDELNIDMLQYPCHTQAVERCVKLVTEASSKVCGEENREGYIASQIQSRKEIPKFESKKDFK